MINYENVVIPCIGYNELIKIKSIAGRPQDLADIYKPENRNKKKKKPCSFQIKPFTKYKG